jgi:hypothetical protein
LRIAWTSGARHYLSGVIRMPETKGKKCSRAYKSALALS